jgi:hypothetical protein
VATAVNGQPTAPEKDSYLVLEDLLIRDNFLVGSQSGVRLDGYTFHYDETRIVGNAIRTGSDAGIILTGRVISGGGVTVADNQVDVSGDGIQVGTSDTRVCNNDITAGTTQRRGNGITLVTGVDPSGIAGCQVIGNRIASATGAGISVQTHVLAALIKQNFIENTGDGGIVMDRTSRADVLSIANNQLHNIGVQPNTELPLAGIQLYRVAQAEVTSNTLNQVATGPQPVRLMAGILVMASAVVRIAGNQIIGVGPPEVFRGQGFGILVQNTFDQVEIVENLVRRGPGQSNERFSMSWYALGVQGASKEPLEGPSMAFVPLQGTDMVGYFGDQFVQLSGRAENLLVRGNRFESAGAVPAVRIFVQGSCVFTDNQCVREAG